MTQPEDPETERRPFPWPIGTDFATGEPEMADLNDGIRWPSEQEIKERFPEVPLFNDEEIVPSPKPKDPFSRTIYLNGSMIRQRKHEANGVSFHTTETICPTCGQPHP